MGEAENGAVKAAIIGGEYVMTDSVVEVMNPSTGGVLATTADCGPREIQSAVEAARGTQKKWRRVAQAERIRLVREVGRLIQRDLEDLAQAESLQTGKPIAQGRRDIEITARYFDFYASVAESFYGSSFSLTDSIEVTTRFEPHGVTAHIIPWNYPMQILGRSLAPSLVTGNCAVIKPAEEAPLTALMLAALVREAGIPDGAVNVVTGMGETAGAALAASPGIDHMSFTGSVEVGRIIGRAAAESLIPVTLELGGKSPNIVFPDADLDRAIPVIANSILQNGGQTCSAGSRLLVHASVHDEVVNRLAAHFASVRVGPALSDPDLGPLISQIQRQRVLGFIDLGRDEAKVLAGGRSLSGGTFQDGYFVEPTLIDNVSQESRLYQEEVFGPVLAVTSFETTDEAVELANATDYGLVAGVWTTNISTAHQMVRDVVAGQVFVNTYGASGGVELPFGGFKKSGFGREKGVEGIRGFVQVKTAIVAS